MVTYNVSLENKVVLVTGAAGFIGANLVKRLLAEFDSIKVIGIDSITEYYDVRLKYERLEELSAYRDGIFRLWKFGAEGLYGCNYVDFRTVGIYTQNHSDEERTCQSGVCGKDCSGK